MCTNNDMRKLSVATFRNSLIKLKTKKPPRRCTTFIYTYLVFENKRPHHLLDILLFQDQLLLMLKLMLQKFSTIVTESNNSCLAKEAYSPQLEMTGHAQANTVPEALW